MRLNPDFITQTIDDTQFLIPVGSEAFSGIVRGNATAAFIIDCLKEDTSPEQITDAMCARFDAPRDVIAADVAKVIEKLRGIHAIIE